AHVALADDATLGVVLGHAVRAVPGAVLAADAGIGAVQHDAGRGVLGVRINRTTLQARRLQAVMTADRHIRTLGSRIPAAFDFGHVAPVDRGRVSVLLVAGHDTAFAADAFAHVDVKAILLAGAGRANGHARSGLTQRGRAYARRQHECDAVFGGTGEQR